jgi:hypothetical protein
VVARHAGISFCYVVTADHVARELEQAHEPIAKLNDDQERGYHYRLDTPWHRHPSDSSADVAVTRFSPAWAVKQKPFARFPHIPTWLFVRDNELHPTRGQIGIGDEVFIIGLFTHVSGEDSNTPICRVGNVAMLPRERVYTGPDYGYMDAMLIETRSVGGISGAPVFVRGTHEVRAISNFATIGSENLKMGDLDPKGVASSSGYSLLGVAHGHWDISADDVNAPNPTFVRNGLNVGIGIVTPARKIIETLDQPTLLREREEVAEEANKRKATGLQDAVGTQEPP